MLEIQINRSLWEEWKNNPVTNLYFQQIAKNRSSLADYVLSGIREPSEYARCVGAIQAFTDAMNVEFQEGEESND